VLEEPILRDGVGRASDWKGSIGMERSIKVQTRQTYSLLNDTKLLEFLAEGALLSMPSEAADEELRHVYEAVL
jgi:hypothetical protein